MTVRDDGLKARQEAAKRYEMRSNTQKPQTFDLLTWCHNSKLNTYIILITREDKVPLRSVVQTIVLTLDASKECR